METKIREYFDGIVNKAKAKFNNVSFVIDHSPERAILRINAEYKKYRIFTSELLNEEYRKYNYYLLEVDFVVVGMDNSQDHRAIRLKYGKMPEKNKDRLVPHIHLNNKTELQLTDEMHFEDFIAWIEVNLD